MMLLPNAIVVQVLPCAKLEQRLLRLFRMVLALLRTSGGSSGFFRRLLSGTQWVIEEQKKQATLKENGEKMSRSEVNAVNRKQINDARRRMAEKYGDDYSDEN